MIASMALPVDGVEYDVSEVPHLRGQWQGEQQGLSSLRRVREYPRASNLGEGHPSQEQEGILCQGAADAAHPGAAAARWIQPSVAKVDGDPFRPLYFNRGKVQERFGPDAGFSSGIGTTEPVVQGCFREDTSNGHRGRENSDGRQADGGEVPAQEGAGETAQD